MNQELEHNLRQAEEAIHAVESISHERDIKGNANVTAGRYGELVANMVKYAESQMALQALKQSESDSTTASLYQGPEARNLPSRQHVEPESLRGQNVINPT